MGKKLVLVLAGQAWKHVYWPEYAGRGCGLVLLSYIGRLMGLGAALSLSGRPLLALSLRTCSTLAMIFL